MIYVVRDVETKGINFLLWGYSEEQAAVTMQDAPDQWELVTFESTAQMDDQTLSLIFGADFA